MNRAPTLSPTVCFLLGLPRSGTTLLAHLLQQHPDLLAPPEPWLMLALESLGTVDRGHPADATLVDMAANEFFGRIDRAAASRALADAAYGQYLAAAGKRCFIDKTPRYWMATNFIDKLYPEAPRIVLLRNPYAIAASLKSTWNITLLPESCPPAHSSYLADLVLGLPALAPHRDHPKTVIIRYETLVAQPAEEVQRLVVALGYDPAGITSTTTEKTDYLKSGNFGDRKILQKKSVDDRSIDAWRSELNLEEMQAVTDMVGAELLIALGYDRELQRVREAGVVDKGEQVTERHRKVFEAWWTLRSGRKAAVAIGELARAEPRCSAAPMAGAESSTSLPDPSVMQAAQLLAESDTERALRLANAATDDLRQALTTSEADRAVRLAVIHEHEATVAAFQGKLEQLQAAFAESEADRAAQLTVIHGRDTTINALKAELEQAQGALAQSTTTQAAMVGSRWWKLGRRLNIVRSVELPPQKLRMFRSETPEVLAFHAASTTRALEKIAARGLEIATVIDVGASNGMWSAVTRQSFPEAGYLLIEAQKVHEPHLIDYCRTNSNTDYVLAAAGDSIGQIYFDDSAPFGGVASHQPTGAARTVLPVTTIDHEVATRQLNSPFLIKLDTHGFEVPILQGAAETLKQANLVVIEVYNFKITDQSLLFDEMCAYMRTLGFGVIDISEPLWRQRDNAFWQLDLFFVPLTRPEFAARTYT